MKHLIFFIAFSSLISLNAKELVLGVDSGLLMEDPKIKVLIKKLKKSYKDIGIELRTKTVPGARVVKALEDGLIDSEVGRFMDTIKKYNLSFVPIPLMKMRACVYSKSKKMGKPLREANVISFRGIKVFDNFPAGLTSRANSDLQAYKTFVKRNNFDYLLSIDLNTSHYIKKHNGIPLYCVKEIAVFELFHIVSSRNVHILPSLTKAIERNFSLNN